MEGRFTVSSPTRVDLAGGTLDLWPLFCFTEGAKTINLAIDLYAQVRFEFTGSHQMTIDVKGPGGEQHRFHAPLSMRACRELDPALRFPVAVLSAYMASRRELPAVRMEVSWKTQAPIGSGLGGSSSLGVALLRGISRVFGDYSEMGWQWKLLAAIRDIEAAFLETPTGTQDYLAALFGGLSCFSSRPGEIIHAPYPAGAFESLSERLLVLFSGEQHHSGRSNWEVYKAAVEREPGVSRGLLAIREIAESVDGQLRSTEIDWKKLGKLLGEEWRARRELFGVSTPRLDTIVDSLQKKAILGVKVCGAAAGGSLLVLVEPEHRTAVAAEIEREGIQILRTQPVPRGISIS